MSFWLVSFPRKLAANPLSDRNLEASCPIRRAWELPRFRVGTLDILYNLSEEIMKCDSQVHAILKKIEKGYIELIKGEQQQAQASQEKVQAQVHKAKVDDKSAQLSVKNKSPDQYVSEFKWDHSRYSPALSLKALVDQIMKNAIKEEDDVKKTTTEFNEVRSAWTAIEKKDSGSLLVKPLGNIVKPEHIKGQDYLSTIFVVVPKSRQEEFLASYETIESNKSSLNEEKSNNKEEEQPLVKAQVSNAELEQCNVVPGSAQKLSEDDEFVLYRIVALKVGLDKVLTALKERRYNTRQYNYDPEETKKNEEQKKSLSQRKDKLYEYLLQQYRTKYSDLFSSFVHLKAIRLFVETILRYGPFDPSDQVVPYHYLVLLPERNKEKNVKDTLSAFCAKIADVNMMKPLEANETDLSGLGNEFYPWVYLNLNISE